MKTAKKTGIVVLLSIAFLGTLWMSKPRQVLAEGPYRHLKLIVQAASNLKVNEVEWMSGSTAYPTVNMTGEYTGSLHAYGTDTLEAWKCFDGGTNESDGDWVGAATPHEIVIDLGSGAAIEPSAIKIYKPTWGLLTSLKCQGSNDGSTWTTLYENTNTGDTGSSLLQ
ncbi:MAG: hypothetical protein ACM3WV_07485, partial [Bacillota bacterium]